MEELAAKRHVKIKDHYQYDNFQLPELQGSMGWMVFTKLWTGINKINSQLLILGVLMGEILPTPSK